MVSIPSNYTAPAVLTSVASVDNAKNAARLASVEALGDVILSTDPKVSIDQKLEAYSSLGNLVSRDWRLEGAREAMEKAYWLSTESPIAKQIQDVGNRYQNMGMSEGRAAQARGGDEEWTGGNPIKAFSKFSESDQKVLMVALGLDTQYASVKDAYDDFQRQSDEAVARYQASKQDKPVTVSLSDEAKTLLGEEAAAKLGGSEAEQALAILTSAGPKTSQADLALKMLEKAAEARAEAKAEEKRANAKLGAEPTRTSLPYQAGDRIDETA